MPKIENLDESNLEFLDPGHVQTLSPGTTRANTPKALEPEKSKSKFKEIAEDKTVLMNLICMMTVWLSASFNYYLIGY